jgi:serine/threonine protein kinase
MEEQRYRIIDLLETGGMAEVFRGEALNGERSGKAVALKRVLPSLANNERFARMFLDEARLGVRLNHPNIVRIYDVGAADGSYFIVMEFIDGVDLKTLLDQLQKHKRRPGVREALFIAMELCSALSHAHGLRDEHGTLLDIVHRDISPPNVMLTKGGEVKLMDFGLAKATTQLEATDPGVVKGKFGYLSPEAALGLEVDPRADLFSVGVVLWEALAGRRLFLGETDYDTVKNVQRAEIPALTGERREADAELDALLGRMLAKDRGERFQSAAEMRDAIADYLARHQLEVTAADVSHLVRYALARRDRSAGRGSSEHPLRDVALAFSPLASITRTGYETLPPVNIEANRSWFSLRWLAQRLSPTLPTLAEPPHPFGANTQWLAMRAAEPVQAFSALQSVDGRFAGRRAYPCGWARGVDCATGKASPRGVYLTPEQDGQVLALGYQLRTRQLDELRSVLGGLSQALQCRVCLFGSYAAASGLIVAVAERGELVRAYVHAEGKTELDFGERLPEERSGDYRYLEDLTAGAPAAHEAGDRGLSGERHVLSLAGRLSVDPSRFGTAPYTHPGVGLLVR